MFMLSEGRGALNGLSRDASHITGNSGRQCETSTAYSILTMNGRTRAYVNGTFGSFGICAKAWFSTLILMVNRSFMFLRIIQRLCLMTHCQGSTVPPKTLGFNYFTLAIIF